MNLTEIHLYEVTHIAEQRTVRYTCRACGRCMEDRPDALVLLHAGDTQAAHRGGSLSDVAAELEQDAAPSPPTLRH